MRSERCSSCLFRLRYDKQTRDRVMGDAEAADGFIQCHKHAKGARVCCRGYYDSIGENGCTAVQLAIRFERMGMRVVEWVPPDAYPPTDDEGDDDDEQD